MRGNRRLEMRPVPALSPQESTPRTARFPGPGSDRPLRTTLLSGSRKVIGSRVDLVLLYSIFFFVVKGYEIRYNRYSGHGAEVELGKNDSQTHGVFYTVEEALENEGRQA